MVTSIALFQGGELPAGAVADVAVAGKPHAKTGAVTVGYEDRKSYGKRMGLKKGALDRAHLEYRLRLGMVGNVNVAAKIAAGEWITAKVNRSETKDGVVTHTVKFNEKSLFEVPVVTAETTVAGMTAEQLMAAMTPEQRRDLAILAALAPATGQAAINV